MVLDHTVALHADTIAMRVPYRPPLASIFIYLNYPGCGYRLVPLQKSLPEAIELYTYLPTISILYVALHMVVCRAPLDIYEGPWWR